MGVSLKGIMERKTYQRSQKEKSTLYQSVHAYSWQLSSFVVGRGMRSMTLCSVHAQGVFITKIQSSTNNSNRKNMVEDLGKKPGFNQSQLA